MTTPLDVTFVKGTNISSDWLNGVNDGLLQAITDINSILTRVNDANSSISGSSNRTLEAKVADFINIKDFGVIGDGVTDDTTNVQSVITTIGTTATTLVISSPVKVSGAITFGSNTELVFLQNGRIIGTAGTEVIQVQRQIIAGSHTIFSACVPSATTAMVVVPEWFGAVKDGTTGDQAAFIAAYYMLRNTGGVIKMSPGDYGLTATITGVKSHVTLIGAGQAVTRLMMRTANTAGLQAYGNSTADKLLGPVFKDFTLRLATEASAGCFGLDLQYSAFAKTENVEVAGFLYGFKTKQSSNGIYKNMLCTYQGNTTGSIMYVIDGDGGFPSNASSVFDHCWYQGNANISNAVAASSMGFRWTGAYMSDMEFINPQGTQTAYGMYLDFSTAGAHCVDVTLINPVIDQFLSHGILITGVGEYGAITINGGWINAKNTGAATDDVYISNSRGVTLTGGLQLLGNDNYANARGVSLSNAYNICISSGVIFGNLKYSILGTSTGYCQFSGKYRNTSGATATAYISLTGDARSFVSNAIFDGYATQAVIIDATSSGSGITNCCANITNIPTRFTNNASGAIGGANGSTGLNSGY